MTAQEYIISTLEELKQPVQIEELGGRSLEEAIFAKVMSKKFRKKKADDVLIERTKKAISLSIKEKKPITLNMIFGGNKLWHFEEAPEIDWAELFATIYYLQWAKSITSIYKHGAHFEYYSEDVVLETMNNLPIHETDQYSDSFKAMLSWMKPFFPPNVSVTYKRYGDEYASRKEYEKELEEAKEKVLKELGGKLPILTDAQKHATELNVRLKPGQADDSSWREKVELIHQSIERTRTLERYINHPYMISACPTYYPGWAITTGSTKKSYAKFWVGVGALERNGDKFSEIVLTQKQLESANFDWQNVDIEGLKGKNFKRIRVLKPYLHQ